MALYRSLRSNEELVFCRFTQLGFLRLLTIESVAKDETLSQRQAWVAYDRWINSGGALFLDEPLGLETELKGIADRTTPAPKEWMDSYLAAFAAAGPLKLVTFDRALSLRAKRAILLK